MNSKINRTATTAEELSAMLDAVVPSTHRKITGLWSKEDVASDFIISNTRTDRHMFCRFNDGSWTLSEFQYASFTSAVFWLKCKIQENKLAAYADSIVPRSIQNIFRFDNTGDSVIVIDTVGASYYYCKYDRDKEEWFHDGIPYASIEEAKHSDDVRKYCERFK